MFGFDSRNIFENSTILTQLIINVHLDIISLYISS